MGSQGRAGNQFRKRLKAERELRDWSQEDVAKMLSDKGIHGVYATTISKIEAGDRAVRVDELAGIADLFGASLDGLIGRSLNPARDLTFTLQTFMETVRQSYSQVSSLEASLRSLTLELAAFQFDERDALTTGGDQACAALATARQVLAEVFRTPGQTILGASFDALLTETIDRLAMQEVPNDEA
jgi:transcriptional regulator with XRE-family HTH domain